MTPPKCDCGYGRQGHVGQHLSGCPSSESGDAFEAALAKAEKNFFNTHDDIDSHELAFETAARWGRAYGQKEVGQRWERDAKQLATKLDGALAAASKERDEARAELARVKDQASTHFHNEVELGIQLEHAKENLSEARREIERLKGKDAEFVRVLNEILGSNNKKNPHLGITAGAQLLKSERDETRAERDKWERKYLEARDEINDLTGENP